MVETYSDRAISGASMIRAGIQELLADAQAGRFDMVLSEALDRLSRDQEDVAAVYKRLRFAGVSIVTLSEGEINERHVGLKGTMNALFLKDLAIKTHRGQRGRVEAGKAGSGRAAYGYRVIHQRLHLTNRPVTLLSGLLVCGCCGGRVSMIMTDRYACRNHLRKGILQ